MFSNATKYAIRAVLFLSTNKATAIKYKVDIIAKDLVVPKAFLGKILQKLAKNNLISSTRGRGGGFYLSESNLSKSLLDIVVCIEGYNIFDECVLGLPVCSEKRPCRLHHQYKECKQKFTQIISDISIDGLVENKLV